MPKRGKHPGVKKNWIWVTKQSPEQKEITPQQLKTVYGVAEKRCVTGSTCRWDPPLIAGFRYTYLLSLYGHVSLLHLCATGRTAKTIQTAFSTSEGSDGRWKTPVSWGQQVTAPRWHAGSCGYCPSFKYKQFPFTLSLPSR